MPRGCGGLWPAAGRSRLQSGLSGVRQCSPKSIPVGIILHQRLQLCITEDSIPWSISLPAVTTAARQLPLRRTSWRRRQHPLKECLYDLVTNDDVDTASGVAQKLQSCKPGTTTGKESNFVRSSMIAVSRQRTPRSSFGVSFPFGNILSCLPGRIIPRSSDRADAPTPTAWGTSPHQVAINPFCRVCKI